MTYERFVLGQRWRTYVLAMSLSFLGVTGSDVIMAQSIPASTEEVIRESDLVVAGMVTATDPEGIDVGPLKQLYTRHTFKVEAYFKGSGPKEISVLTPGGFWTSHEGGKDRKLWANVVGAVGVKEGEEILAFLKALPEGYLFVEWDGAKYPIQTDPESGIRSVDLRLRKKQYMRGGALEGFKKLEAMEHGPNTAAAVEAKLSGPKFLTEMVSITELRARLEEIDRGEKGPKPR